jgi:hypothetical protein
VGDVAGEVVLAPPRTKVEPEHIVSHRPKMGEQWSADVAL